MIDVREAELADLVIELCGSELPYSEVIDNAYLDYRLWVNNNVRSYNSSLFNKVHSVYLDKKYRGGSLCAQK